MPYYKISISNEFLPESQWHLRDVFERFQTQFKSDKDQMVETVFYQQQESQHNVSANYVKEQTDGLIKASYNAMTKYQELHQYLV